FFGDIAQDTLAMIVNDLITVGALPISVAMHLAVGDSDWFKDEPRYQDLIKGWKYACNLARCTWGGGETPTLRGVVIPGTVVLSGSALGIIQLKKNLITGECIQHGDAIILIESSGIHANGLTLARRIADKLPEGYLTKLSDGRTYGETLLDPTCIYVPLIEDCQKRGVNIHYVVNITGHGWRKLMRATQPFKYVIEHLPKQLPIFDFIQKSGPVDDKEAYGNLNMGAGLAIYVSPNDVKVVWDLLEEYPSYRRFGAVLAGHIERSKQRSVVIKPKGITFKADSMKLR
ncbi:MAG: AIR synthase-related protein, partial [bacterium]|nr:AIR synthase-related protein [bacterium]